MGSQKHVLVVDDDASFLSVLVRCLSNEGYRVDGVRSGFDALELLEHGDYDLIVSDLVMPEMDGFELLSALRRRSPSVPVIVMSGGGRIAGDVLLRPAIALGAARLLPKPFSMDALVAAVRLLAP